MAQFGRFTKRIISTRLTASEYKVYLTLALFAGEKSDAWPSQKKMALITGLPIKTVSRATTTLEKKGLLQIEREQGVMNHYWLPDIEEINQEQHQKHRTCLQTAFSKKVKM